ncbi:hypothetical protein [Patiriisocius sp. Uisw_017]|uniref:hypothetical protein n=1 Tax=Patiriisocius sp. Uisw_017 TaxID=3230968 RepID=UPI0039EAA476
MTTLRACPDLTIDEIEILNVFNLVDNFTSNDDVLSLNVGRFAISGTVCFN